MRYTVMLREHSAGRYIAIAPAVPDCRVEGRTRHEALERLKLTLEEWLRGTEVTSIEVSTPQADQARKETLGWIQRVYLPTIQRWSQCYRRSMPNTLLRGR